MNRVAKGLCFERKAFSFLKKKYDKVIWNSFDEKNTPSIDFFCWKDGKKYLIEAKSNLVCNISQFQFKNADYIITQKNKELVLIKRKYFKKYFNVVKNTKFLVINEKTKKDLLFFQIEYYEDIKKMYNKRVDINRTIEFMIFKINPNLIKKARVVLR